MVLGYATSKGATFFDPERNVALHPNISAHASACTLGRAPSSCRTPTCQCSSMHTHSAHEVDKEVDNEHEALQLACQCLYSTAFTRST